jgi:hypothetical protein
LHYVQKHPDEDVEGNSSSGCFTDEALGVFPCRQKALLLAGRRYSFENAEVRPNLDNKKGIRRGG